MISFEHLAIKVQRVLINADRSQGDILQINNWYCNGLRNFIKILNNKS